MTRLIRSEAQKLVTIWSTYVLVGIALVVTGLIGFAVSAAPHARPSAAFLAPRGTASWYDSVLSAMGISQDLALVLGILVVTVEYRHKTATPTFLSEPRRGRVTAAKLLVSLGGGLTLAVAAGIGGLVLGASLVGSGAGTGTVMLTAFRGEFKAVLIASLLFAVYGVGLGALLRNQVLALVVGLGVTFVVEPIFVVVWPSVARWLPSQATRSLAPPRSALGGGASGLTHLLPSWEGVLVLLAYGVALAVAGSLTSMRADVT